MGGDGAGSATTRVVGARWWSAGASGREYGDAVVNGADAVECFVGERPKPLSVGRVLREAVDRV